jgi:hypothetical protein
MMLKTRIRDDVVLVGTKPTGTFLCSTFHTIETSTYQRRIIIKVHQVIVLVPQTLQGLYRFHVLSSWSGMYYVPAQEAST